MRGRGKEKGKCSNLIKETIFRNLVSFHLMCFALSLNQRKVVLLESLTAVGFRESRLEFLQLCIFSYSKLCNLNMKFDIVFFSLVPEKAFKLGVVSDQRLMGEPLLSLAC